MTMNQLHVLTTIFCYDAEVDGDNMTAAIYMDGTFLYVTRIL